MKIQCYIPCVGYADQLDRSLHLWHWDAQVTVVTDLDDDRTMGLVGLHEGVGLHLTDRWRMDGAAFNKAGALSEAIGAIDDWCLLVDADVVPPRNWRQIVEAAEPDPGYLYGARRYDEQGRLMHDPRPCGWFLLFHGSDPNAQRRPLFDDWHNASGYDTEFEQRWGDDKHRWVDGLALTHLGESGVNWCGVGNEQGMREMKARRAKHGWRAERLNGDTESD